MKTLVLTGEKGVGGIVLEERPAPIPGPGEVRIRMRAHTLNHIDIWVLSGSPAYSVPCPHIMGSEGVGTVESLGVGVDPLLGLSPGQTVAISPGQGCLVCELCRSGSESLCSYYRVLGGHLPGIFSEIVCLPASRLIPVPDGVDALSASAVTLAGATAHQALVARGLAKPGEKWLVVGASGGVGHLACLLGKTLKIEMVGTYGPERKREPLSRGLGIPLVSHEAADWTDRLRESSGQSFDGVLDTVGGATVPRVLPLLRKGGRAVVVGETTGAQTQFPTRELFGRQLSLHGVYLAHRMDIVAMLGWLSRGAFLPIVSSVGSLETVDPLREAYQRMIDRDFVGKIGFVWHPQGGEKE